MVPIKIGPNTKSYMICMFSIAVLASCGVAPQHHVRTGEDPRYQDKMLHFKQPIILVVFDYCYDEHKKQSTTISQNKWLVSLQNDGQIKYPQ